jgi:hypothetical protein
VVEESELEGDVLELMLIEELCEVQVEDVAVDEDEELDTWDDTEEVLEAEEDDTRLEVLELAAVDELELTELVLTDVLL